MLYVVQSVDHRNVVDKRLNALSAHRDYLQASGMKIVCAGPLLTKDGKTPVGSLFIVDAETMQDVVKFNENDPLSQQEIWSETTIMPFDMRIDNRT